MNASDLKTADATLAALLHDYIDLYSRDKLERWRELFLPQFVALSTNSDGSVTTWNLDEFFERQRRSFATGKPISEVLENVAAERIGRLAQVRADFVWSDGDVRRRGALMLLVVERHGELRIQSLAFGYD
jgi:SnoaL-like domain